MAFAQAAERSIPGAVATLGVNERVAFIRKTYAHLAGAIVAFIVLEAMFLQTELALRWTGWAFNGGMNWLLVLGLFMVASWVAHKWAFSDVSRTVQYLGLGLYILAEVLVFAPFLLFAKYQYDTAIIGKAAVITLAIFGGMTAVVFLTRKDFSFLRGILGIGAFAVMGLIVASIIFGFNLGLLFTVGVIVLLCGYILYHTSMIMAHFPPTYYVGAALALFADVITLFWYVLRLVMSLSSD